MLIKTPSGKSQIIFLENHDLDRFASLEGNVHKQKLAASLQLLIGGIPAIYYGQEIGMKGKGGHDLYGNGDGNDIPRREAFEWHKTVEGKGVATWYANTGPWWVNRNIKSGDGISVEEQKDDPNSLMNHYKTILKLRASHEALSAGAYSEFDNNNDFVFSFIRKTDGASVLVAANLSDRKQIVALKDATIKFNSIYGKVRITNGRFELNPFQVAVWEIE